MSDVNKKFAEIATALERDVRLLYAPKPSQLRKAFAAQRDAIAAAVEEAMNLPPRHVGGCNGSHE